MLDGRTSGIHAYQAALEEAQDLGNLGTFILDLREGVYRLVGVLARAYGRTEIPAEEVASEAKRVFHPDDARNVSRLMDSLKNLRPFEGEFRMYVEGETRWFQGRTKIVRDKYGAPTGIIGTVVDITDRKLEAEKLKTLAFTDPETGMPNRAALLQGAETNMALEALMLVRFLWIGATSQRSPENRVKNAQAIRDILHSIVPVDSTVFRYGDEVAAITFPRSTEIKSIRRIAENIVASFANPVEVDGETLVASARIGFAYAEDGKSVSELARRAEAALREAERIHPHIAVYTAALERAHDRRATIDRNLRYAAAKGQLHGVYQPIFCVATQEIVGAEALLRWECPGIGEVPPDEFIGIAEDSGVIVSLGEWILEKAFAQSRRWREEGLDPIRMSINVSVRQARQPNFVPFVRSLSQKYDIPLSDIELELTERAIIYPEGPGALNLRALRALGMRVAIDDFGTGYSALSYLAQMDIDTLKIDRMFVAPLADEPFQRDVTASLVELAHKRDLLVVGEGVETREQLECLQTISCDEAQGFYCARPMPATEFAILMRS